MDQAKLSSKAIFLGVILTAALLTGGCETAKGFASGIGSTVEGAGKDTYNAWNFLKNADSWVDKNLW
jgi:predicted small secreted protein